MCFEYAVIGAGPAGILAVMRILEKILEMTPKGVDPRGSAKKICWIDPKFNVGAFGQQWKNVPGNTTSEKYQLVYNEVFNILEKYGFSSTVEQFDLYTEDLEYPSLLKTAAVPLEWITKQLQTIVTPINGHVLKILSGEESLHVYIQTQSKSLKIISQRCVLAIGGEAKILSLPCDQQQKHIPLEVALDHDLLEKFISQHPDLLKGEVLVQGSSHSAALAVWNLLTCGASVKHIMNKPYLYYRVEKDSNGNTCVYNDNDGLKGKVAEFTRLLEAKKIYADKWTCEIKFNRQSQDYSAYRYVVFAIGLQSVNTLTIDNIPSATISYNFHTTETVIPGVFVIGVGHPPLSSDGSKNVGISKFWPDIRNVISIWQEKPAKTKTSVI